MYQDSDLRTKVRQRFWLMFPVVCFSVLAMFCYFGLLTLVRADLIAWGTKNIGAESEKWLFLPLLMMALCIFMLPIYFAERRAKRYSISCPSCGKDHTLLVERILKTRCCSSCGKRVVKDGKMRSKETYARYCQRRWRSYLVYWFWLWPAFGGIILIWRMIDLSSFENCPHMMFIFGFSGTIATGWSLIRTNDRRYLAQAIASAVVLVLGIVAFLQ